MIISSTKLLPNIGSTLREVCLKFMQESPQYDPCWKDIYSIEL